jgi:hypothetical protein
MTCAISYKLHTLIEAVLTVHSYKSSETRHLITWLRISHFDFTTPRQHQVPLSQIVQFLQFLTTNRITTISYTCSRVFHPFCIFSSIIWDSDSVFYFSPFFLFDYYHGQAQISTHFTITHPAPKTRLWLCLQIC